MFPTARKRPPTALVAVFATTLALGALGPDQVVGAGDSARTVSRGDEVTRLYGATAELEGKVRYESPKTKPPGSFWLVWEGDGTANWKISVPKAGEYEASLCYASRTAGAIIAIAAGKQTAGGAARVTEGFFPDELPAGVTMNFERVPQKGTIKLTEGENALQLRLAKLGGETIRVRSLELTPVDAKDRIRDEEKRARASRANTDWLVRAGYGVMFHWTSQVQPLKGKQKPYAEAVKEFDLPAFVKMVEGTGAGYVVFTVNHGDPHCPAPIKAWERIHPGWTTKRDLIGEMADEFGKRGIWLMLYLASDSLGGVHRRKVTGDEYQKILEEVLTEIGTRYGEKVAGYWFDHWMWSLENYPNLSLKNLSKAVKAGNPQRLVAYNFWVYPVETEWQDFWAAEVGLIKPAEGRRMAIGPAKGLQYHATMFLDSWMHTKPDSEIKSPLYKDEQVVKFVKGCMAKEGVVTINLSISQDGKVGEASLRQMKLLRKAIREK
ncbi:MAG: alpha-L-fucosidase [Planctomycetes bacterium]|nr:alpha-L-fucosidase [Planctomycetota bacterium]